MNAERMKILEMLAEGKITADDADKLLDKISAQPTPDAKSEAKPVDGSSPKRRFLHIVVDKPGQDQVNVRMPLGLLRTGTHLMAVLPTRVREKLSEQGIDLTAVGAMDEKDWQTCCETLNVDIEKGDGKKVKIFCD